MNTPNPLVPQGTFADKGKHHIRITVFAILAVHVVLLGVLLIAGCDKKNPTTAGTDPNLPAQPTPPLPDPVWPPIPTPPPSTTAGLTTGNSTGLPPAGLPPSGLVPVPAPGAQPPAGAGIAPPPAGNIVDTPPAPSTTEHTVVKGDSFSTLGKRYKVGSLAIAAANPGVDSTRLKLGQKLQIPPPKAPAGAASGGGLAPAASASGEIIHTVKSGDNLWTLARKYGVRESEIRSANNMKLSQLKVGQKLKIPSKAPPPVEATAPAPSLPPVTPGIPETAPPGFAPATR